MQATPAAVSAYASIGSSTDFSYSLNIPQGTGFTEPSFQVTPPSGNLDGGASSGAAVTPIYTFCVAGSGNPDCTLTGTGYDPAGNLLSYTDAGTNGPIMGTWKFQYDTLNRLAGATDNQPGNTNTNYCWSYDAFGNRQQQAGSNALFTNSVGAPTCTAANGASFNNVWARYTVDGTTSTPDNGKNQVTATPAGNVIYDPSGAGYILNDAINQYLYDGEGRICAVAATNAFGATLYTGYLYDADGTRVAKGTITSWSCDPTLSGFKTTNDYLLGPGGEQLTEMGIDTTVSGSTATNTLTWQHANIWAGGKLLGTYDKNGLHFYFDDPLGTRRAQTDYAGVLEQTCASLPYGDLLSCTGGDLQAPTEHHFTGKERDAESGNDYFGARYYASTMGRFLSPDWSAKVAPVPYAKLDDPQSLNLYAYMLNNPLGGVDADGHDPGEDIQGSQDLSRAVSLYFAAHPTVAFTVAHPLIAWQVGWVQNGWTNISTNSQRFAAGMGMTERETRLGVHEGSERNAMRHTIWQATLTAKFGHGTATQIGNAHEENPNVDLSIRTFSGGGQAAWDRADQTVDLLNNQIGRAIGDANPGASMNQLAGAALDYYHSTGLYTASQGADGTVSISQTRLSDQQYAAGKQALQKMDQNGR
jgi:RHS repeat-associated protein